MRTYFKKSVIFVSVAVGTSLIMGGGIFRSVQGWHQRWQKIKSLEAKAQEERSTLIEQKRVQHLITQQPLPLRNLLQRSINPPDRETCFKLMQKAKQIKVHKVDFSPEKRLHSIEGNQLCQQSLNIKFVTPHDLYMVEWWDFLKENFPGALTIKYIRIERALDEEGKYLKGEIECDWFYIIGSQ